MNRGWKRSIKDWKRWKNYQIDFFFWKIKKVLFEGERNHQSKEEKRNNIGAGFVYNSLFTNVVIELNVAMFKSEPVLAIFLNEFFFTWRFFYIVLSFERDVEKFFHCHILKLQIKWHNLNWKSAASWLSWEINFFFLGWQEIEDFFNV